MDFKPYFSTTTEHLFDLVLFHSMLGAEGLADEWYKYFKGWQTAVLI